MIRWRFIAVRGLVVITALLLVRWTSGPVVQWLVVRTLQSTTGGRVDIGATEVGFFPPRIELRDFAVADPRKEYRDLFAAEDVSLSIDGQALLKRRYEIANARITGVEIGGQRTTSGKLDVVVDEDTLEESGPSPIALWVTRLSADAQANAKEFGESLETFQTATKIRQRWEAEYAELRQRAERLEATVKTLRDNARSIDNPLRDLPVLQESLRKAEQLKQDLLVVQQKLDRLPSEVRTDMQALEEARRQDQQRVASYLPIDLQQEDLELGPELLGGLVREQLQTVRAYLESGQQIADMTVSSPAPERNRGETIFLGQRQHPAWLIRRCEVAGKLTVNSDAFEMTGVLENVTGDRVDGQAPLHARLRLEGPRIVRIDFERHYHPLAHVGGPNRDQLKIHWPRLPLPARKLGRDEEVALVIDGGDLELWVDIQTEGDAIQGRIVSKQTRTQLSLATSDELAETVPVRALRESLALIDHVDVDASFEGDWRSLDLEIATSLNEQLAGGLRLAVSQAMSEGRQQLSQELDKAYRQQVGQMEGWLSDQQAEARKLVARVDEAVAAMSKKFVAELGGGGADAYLGGLRGRLDRVLK